MRPPADEIVERETTDNNGEIHAASSPKSLKAYNRQCIRRDVGVPLVERVAWLVGFVAATTIRRRNILRACVAARYATDLALSSIQAARSREHMRRVQDWLLECKEEISHPDPKMAVRVGVYLTLQSLQTALLFEQIPADLSQRHLIAEAERMLLCYLTTH